MDISGRDEEILDVTRRLVEMPSPNPGGGEIGVAREIVAILAAEGIAATISESPEGRPNVVAFVHGWEKGKTLLFNGHLDVVPPGDGWSFDPWKVRVEGGRLYGRGAADMKGGIAAMLCAALRLKRDGCPFCGTLALLFNADEEHGNLGIRHYLNNPIAADYVVIGEPTELQVCRGHKGDCRIRLAATGTAAHCAVVQTPDNAIYKLARAVTALEIFARDVARRESEVGNASLSVNLMRGGSAPNIVPDAAWLELDRRVLPGETTAEVEAEIRAVAEEAAGETLACDCYLFFPAYSLAADHALTVALVESARAVCGDDRTPRLFPASTEAPFFAIDLETPTAILGPGSLEQAHKADEFVEIEQLTKAVEIYRNLATRLLPLP